MFETPYPPLPRDVEHHFPSACEGGFFPFSLDLRARARVRIREYLAYVMARLINLYLFTFTKCHLADRYVRQNSLQRDTPVEWHSILARDLSFRVIVQNGINNKSYEFLRDHRKIYCRVWPCLGVSCVCGEQTRSRIAKFVSCRVNGIGSLNDRLIITTAKCKTIQCVISSFRQRFQSIPVSTFP